MENQKFEKHLKSVAWEGYKPSPSNRKNRFLFASNPSGIFFRHQDTLDLSNEPTSIIHADEYTIPPLMKELFTTDIRSLTIDSKKLNFNVSEGTGKLFQQDRVLISICFGQRLPSSGFESFYCCALKKDLPVLYLPDADIFGAIYPLPQLFYQNSQVRPPLESVFDILTNLAPMVFHHELPREYLLENIEKLLPQFSKLVEFDPSFEQEHESLSEMSQKLKLEKDKMLSKTKQLEILGKEGTII